LSSPQLKADSTTTLLGIPPALSESSGTRSRDSIGGSMEYPDSASLQRMVPLMALA
jgi:hypothetical protein